MSRSVMNALKDRARKRRARAAATAPVLAAEAAALRADNEALRDRLTVVLDLLRTCRPYVDHEAAVATSTEAYEAHLDLLGLVDAALTVLP